MRPLNPLLMTAALLLTACGPGGTGGSTGSGTPSGAVTASSGSNLTITTDAPATVAPGARTTIHISVQKANGDAVSVPVTVALDGGAHVDLATLSQTPGTVVHTAVLFPGRTATITLTTSSSTGRATKTLTITTAAASAVAGYHLSGKGGDIQIAGTVCNLANVSLRLHRSLKFDPDKEVVIGDKEAAAMCTKTYRAPWDAALKACVKV